MRRAGALIWLCTMDMRALQALSGHRNVLDGLGEQQVHTPPAPPKSTECLSQLYF